MKKSFLLVCLLAICTLVAAGCGSASSESEQGTPEPQGSFSPEDIETFTFEGTEYSFPLSYDTFLGQGWVISEDTYDEIVEYGLHYALPMKHEAYPGVYLVLCAEYWSAAYDGTQSLVDSFKENGIWGIRVQIDPEEVNVEDAAHPMFEVKGVGLDSALEDVIRAFGDGYDPSYTDSGLYLYQIDVAEGDATRYYWLDFSFAGDTLYEINLASCY